MSTSFSSLSHLLDARLLRSLADMGFEHPTPVQAQTIPLALGENKDILARAQTGSGKTAAYCLPVVQKILTSKNALDPDDSTRQSTRGLILVPTRELSEQVTRYLRDLCKYCEDVIQVVNVASTKPLLSEPPDILISTPSRLLSLLQTKSVILTHLESLVIDEADLVLSYGNDEDMNLIFSGAYLPKIYQSFLMSATLEETEDVQMLRGLVLRDPIVLNLLSNSSESQLLTQYVVRCPARDRFLLTYIILKLRLIRGKTLIFVNDVDKSYQVKLFLEQFGIKSCVLNSELPVNSRYHTVQEFNKGVYDYIIATDESGTKEEMRNEVEHEEEFISTQRNITTTADSEPSSEAESEPDSEPSTRKRKRAGTPVPSSKRTKTGTKAKDKNASESTLPPRTETENDSVPHTKSKLKSKGPRKDKEYGLTRGIDFIDVACVINFDLPSSPRGYTHRVGRTARAGRTGMALSFVSPPEVKSKLAPHKNEKDEVLFSKIEKEQISFGHQIQSYAFDMKQVEAFRYRMEDALRSVTKSAVREARIKEIREEILRSERLKAHFEDNPLDLEYLRHDKPLHPTRVQPHMKFVPGYLLPKTRTAPVAISDSISGTSADTGTGGTGTGTEAKMGFVPFRKTNNVRGRGRGRGGRGGGVRGHGGRVSKRKADPLKKFGR